MPEGIHAKTGAASDGPGLKSLIQGKATTLIAEGAKESKRAEKLEHRFRVLRNTLMFLSVVLAAAAGITVLPAGIATWITAALAFAGALVSGFTTAFTPSRKAENTALVRVQWDDLVNDAEIFQTHLPELTDESTEKMWKGLWERRNVLESCGAGQTPTSPEPEPQQ